MSFQVITTNRTSISGIPPSSSVPDIDLTTNSSSVIGYLAAKNLKGSFNTVIGYSAAKYAITGADSTIIGYNSGYYNNGIRNVFLGGSAGFYTSTGANNVMMGNNSGYNNIEGSCNLFLGTEAGVSNDGNNNTYVGNFNTRVYNTTNNNTSLGFGSVAVGGGATSIGFVSWTFGPGSIVVGNGIRNYGSNSFIALTPNNRLPDGSNVSNNYTNIQNVLIADGSNATRLQTANASIVMSNDSTIYATSSNFVLSGSMNLRNIAIDRLLVPSARPLWEISAGLTSTASNGSSLIMRSIYGDTVVTWMDDFEPGVLNFTGKHRCVFKHDNRVLPVEHLQQGMIVVATGEYCDLKDRSSPHLAIDEAIPVVVLSSRARQANAFGVIGSMDVREVNKFALGNMQFRHLLSPGRIIVQSVGEGCIVICNSHGRIDYRNGDLLCTSDVPGCAAKQDDDVVRSSTVAKITCDYSFTSSDVLQTAVVGCTYKF